MAFTASSGAGGRGRHLTSYKMFLPCLLPTKRNSEKFNLTVVSSDPVSGLQFRAFPFVSVLLITDAQF